MFQYNPFNVQPQQVTSMKFEIYHTESNKVSWRLFAKDGSVLAVSPVEFNGVPNARRDLKHFLRNINEADIVITQPQKG